MNSNQRINQLLLQTRGLSSTNLEGTALIERLRKEAFALAAWSCREIDRITDERDEARRLLKAVVDMMRDNMAHDATHPHHLCDFIHRPDIGMCKVCEDWTDAMVMCYLDDFQDEEDGK